jgi:hypothetical protein
MAVSLPQYAPDALYLVKGKILNRLDRQRPRVSEDSSLTAKESVDGTFLDVDKDKLQRTLGTVDVAIAATGDLAEGETEVDNILRLTFDSRYFIIHDNGGGEARVTLKTTTCT